ncbi:hypothetical protein EJB05_54362, partial [Eragrostis curvula]
MKLLAIEFDEVDPEAPPIWRATVEDQEHDGTRDAKVYPGSGRKMRNTLRPALYSALLNLEDTRVLITSTEAVVGAAEIAEKVRAAMADKTLTEGAETVHKSAERATADGGTSHRSLAEFVRRCQAGTVGNAQ